MKKKPLRDRREQDPAFMEQFGKWIQEGRIGDSREVRDLPGILDNEEALKKFQTEGIKAARQVLQPVRLDRLVAPQHDAHRLAIGDLADIVARRLARVVEAELLELRVMLPHPVQ